jgi:hypothetical protein
MENKEFKGQIKIHYKDKIYESIEFNITEENVELNKIIYDISTLGTDHLQFIKLPISETEFIVFSRTQLNECIVQIKVEPITKNVIKKNINLKKQKNEQ